MSAGNFSSGSFSGNPGGFSVDSSSVFGRSGLGGDDVPRRVTRNPNRGWNREEWKARVKDNADALAETLQETYDRLTGKEAPASVLAQVDAIVRPVAARQVGDVPLSIDWRKIALDYDRAMALVRLENEERELQALMDDEDEMMMVFA